MYEPLCVIPTGGRDFFLVGVGNFLVGGKGAEGIVYKNPALDGCQGREKGRLNICAFVS